MKYKIKRTISIFLISLFATNLAAPLVAATVPAGTTIQLRLNQTLTGSNAIVGGFVDLTVVSDVFSPDGALVIKSGAAAEGQVTTATKNGMLGQAGSVGITVTSVTAVDGTRIPVQAVSAVDGENKIWSDNLDVIATKNYVLVYNNIKFSCFICTNAFTSSSYCN